MYGWQYPQYALSSYAGYGAQYAHCPKADKENRYLQNQKAKRNDARTRAGKAWHQEWMDYHARKRDKALRKCDSKIAKAVYEETGEIVQVKTGEIQVGKPSLMLTPTLALDRFSQPAQGKVQIGQMRNGDSAPPMNQQSGMGAADTAGLGKLALSLALLGGTTFVFLTVAKKQGWIGQ